MKIATLRGGTPLATREITAEASALGPRAILMLNFAKSPAEMDFETGSTPSRNFAELLVETLLSDSVVVLRVVDSDETVVDGNGNPKVE